MEKGDLYIDKKVISDTQDIYTKQATAMGDLRTTLTNAIDNLKPAWKSNAATAFFAKFETEWSDNMKKYEDVINHMAQNLTDANSLYEEVYTEAAKLKLDDN